MALLQDAKATAGGGGFPPLPPVKESEQPQGPPQGMPPAGTQMAPPGMAPQGAAPPGMDPTTSSEEIGPGAEEEMTVEEQEEYDRAVQEMAKVVYSKPMPEKIVGGVVPGHEVATAAQFTQLLVDQLDANIDVHESVFASLTIDTVGMVTELIEKGTGYDFSEDEIDQVVNASWEGIFFSQGGDSEMAPTFNEMTRGMTRGDMQGMKARHLEMLTRIKAGQRPEVGGLPPEANPVPGPGGNPNG